MQEALKIWVDRLVDGKVQKINAVCDPSFLEMNEKELQFHTPVQMSGEAYLADKDLVIHLVIRTKVAMPCSICNEMIDSDLKVENFYHTEELSLITDAVFDFSAPLREALLLEIPTHFECSGGKCPARASIEPFLRSSTKQKGDSSHFPFADLKNLEN
ncbi:MAG: hypothetical protein FJZ64_00975 [Chlamydiae bacterium]|nr:hypothetical protein [Chlamydiota bacterium]